MAKGPIARLLKRREPIRPEVAAALEQLDQLVEARPALRDAAALQGAILRAIGRAAPQAGALDMAPARAAEKLEGGVPLLRGERVPLSVHAVQALMIDLCRAMREHQDVAGPAGEIAVAIEQGALDVEALVQEVLGGQGEAIRERAAALGVGADMLCTLLRFSLFPALERLASQLGPLRVAPWRQGYCPTCGSWPLLGEYRGLEQTRFLRCGLCATEWPFDRLLCPFCGSRSHDDLGYLHVEGEEQKRAATCERCRGYIKMLATLTPIAPLELIVLDLATLHLDIVALEKGYAPPA